VDSGGADKHSPADRTWLHRALRAEPGELAPAGLSAALFFFVLLGYFMIRPVREAMGVERGLDDLRWLFYVTAGVSLAAAMGFGALVQRLDRRRFIPIGFRVVIACLLGFAALRAGIAGDLDAAVGRVFYVWLSVINLFVTGIFWAFMADLWTLGQSKRLFPAIGVGGTLGAIVGASVPWQLGEALGPVWLMVLAAVCFEAATRCVLALDGLARRRVCAPARPTGERSVDGVGLLDGLVLVASSPYLLGAAAYVALIAVSSTLIYFAQSELVADASEELSSRIELFAHLDLTKQTATLLVQLFVTSRMIRALGVGVTLGALPVVTVLGFGAVQAASLWPGSEPWMVFAVFTVFQAAHGAARYAIARPARETLSSVLTRDEKYKAKLVTDMFVFRAGDVAGANLDGVLRGAAGLTIGSMLMAVAPMAAVWVILGLWLGAAQTRRARGLETPTDQAGTDRPEGATT
jgi:AAA family ATP:ADP antiporter